MRYLSFTIFLILLQGGFFTSVFSQNSWQNVYTILNSASCGSQSTSCHSAGSANGLDFSQSAAGLYQDLFNQAPSNPFSAGKSYKLVYPGQPDQSVLFRKVGGSIAPHLNMETGEGNVMPPPPAPQISDKQKEYLRQWILAGAPQTGNVVNNTLITDFYDNGGVNSLTDIPLPPPAGEGFQIHTGPFFLAPGTEEEIFTKFETNLPSNTEIRRIDIFMGTFSHHFILFKYRPGQDGNRPYGVRLNAAHAQTELVTANQYSDSLTLPYGTAFIWDQGSVLDLNSHHINYSPTKTSASEVYINVYTQPSGTAQLPMMSQLVPNLQILIPNDGQPHTFSHTVTTNQAPIPYFYVWALTSHTHKYGTGYKVWLRNPDGTKGDLVFDAACPGGVPGCPNPLYDYQHPPLRKFWPFIQVAPQVGMIHEATYVNTGPTHVTWGDTSDDEMMLIGFFFTAAPPPTPPADPTDTTGTFIPFLPNQTTDVFSVHPNPYQGDRLFIKGDFSSETGLYAVIFDRTGKKVTPPLYSKIESKDLAVLNPGQLAPGIYFIRFVRESNLAAQTIRLVVY